MTMEGRGFPDGQDQAEWRKRLTENKAAVEVEVAAAVAQKKAGAPLFSSVEAFAGLGPSSSMSKEQKQDVLYSITFIVSARNPAEAASALCKIALGLDNYHGAPTLTIEVWPGQASVAAMLEVWQGEETVGAPLEIAKEVGHQIGSRLAAL